MPFNGLGECWVLGPIILDYKTASGERRDPPLCITSGTRIGR